MGVRESLNGRRKNSQKSQISPMVNCTIKGWVTNGLSSVLKELSSLKVKHKKYLPSSLISGLLIEA